MLIKRWQVHDWIFGVLILMYLIPVWAFAYFPSQDGPAHVYNSSLILSINEPGSDVLSQFLAINSEPGPTWFGHLLLAGLMLFFTVLVAEKMLISIYILLFAFGARYALSAVNPRSKFLSVLFFPFVYNYLLHMGFYAFSLSLAMGLWVVGYWLKHSDHLTLKNTVILWLLTLVLYLNHVVSLGMVCIMIASLTCGKILFDIFGQGSKSKFSLKKIGEIILNRTSRTIIAFLPSILLAVFFILSRDTISNPGLTLSKRLYNLVHMMPLVSFSSREIWIGSLLFLFLVALSAYFFISKWEKGQFNWLDFFWVAFGLCSAFYLLTPEPELLSANGMSGGGFMDMRVSYYIYFSLLLWLAVHHYSSGIKVAVQCIAILIAIGLIASHVSAYAKINRHLVEYTSVVEHIEPHTTLLPLDSCDGVWTASYRNRVKPFLHASNYIAAERQLMSLRNYEANMGYFPFVFRPEKNPYIHIGTMECESVPPPAQFIDYEERTGGQIDYVSVWLGKKVNTQHENLLSIYRQLDAGYDLIYVSPNGLMELFRRKNRPSEDVR